MIAFLITIWKIIIIESYAKCTNFAGIELSKKKSGPKPSYSFEFDLYMYMTKIGTFVKKILFNNNIHVEVVLWW